MEFQEDRQHRQVLITVSQKILILGPNFLIQNFIGQIQTAGGIKMGV